MVNFFTSEKLYNFEEHFSRFELESSVLLEAIKKDDRAHAPRDVEYVEFLISEMAVLKETLVRLDIPENLIHGDFLPQNILKDQWGIIWVVDWEKSIEYITSIDVMRSVTFTLFDIGKKDFGLSVDEFGKWTKYCINKISISSVEKAHATDLYYLHLVSNIDFLKRLYIERQSLNEKMAGEDYKVCRWFKAHKDEIREILKKN